MKRHELLVGFGLLMFLLGLFLYCPAVQAQEKVITMNYAHFMPIMTKQEQSNNYQNTIYEFLQ